MAVTITEGSDHGSLNGVTTVTIVPAPGTGVKRAVRSIRIVNIDTAAVNIHLYKKVGASSYEFDSSMALAVDGKFQPVSGADVIFLTATDQSLTAVMSGAPATTNPTWVSSWIDRS